jgi:4-aminobutyrate aminotransferase/(S)-3-amino-2-methylpropionate transaminase
MATINLITELPGPRSRALVARRDAATARGAARLTPVAIEKAEGALLTDVDGNVLIDLAGGIGALAVGHCPPTVVHALKDQAEKLIHLCCSTAAPRRWKPASRSAAATPADRP